MTWREVGTLHCTWIYTWIESSSFELQPVEGLEAGTDIHSFVDTISISLSVSEPCLRCLQSRVPSTRPLLPRLHALHLVLAQLELVVEMWKHALPSTRTTCLSLWVFPLNVLLDRIVRDAEDVDSNVIFIEEFERIGDLECSGKVYEAGCLVEVAHGEPIGEGIWWGC